MKDLKIEELRGPQYSRAYYTAKVGEIRDGSTVKRFFCVNSFPKSGSTYTQSVICKFTGASLQFGGDLELEVEQNFSISGIERSVMDAERAGATSILYKFHSLPNFLNLEAIKVLNIGYVNIVRDIFDSMVSIDDHLIRGRNAKGVTLWPGMKLHDYHTWDEDKRYEAIAHFIVPWYFKYISGWTNVDRDSLFRYEDMVNDTERYFRRIEKRLGLSDGMLDFRSLDEKKNTRFNVGVVGRGEHLRAKYMDLFRSYATFFPEFDRDLMGLGAA